MKKVLLVVTAMLLLSCISTSCKKWTCQCKAVGYVSQSELDAALEKHIDDCVSIAESGPIMDSQYNVKITCSY